MSAELYRKEPRYASRNQWELKELQEIRLPDYASPGNEERLRQKNREKECQGSEGGMV